LPIYKAKIKIKERKKKRKCFHIINWIKIKKFDYLNLKSAYPKVTFLQLKGCNKDSVRSLIKGHRIYHTFLLYLGVARANRSICIISARGQGAAQDPQWVQCKAMVGCPGGLAPGFYQIYILQNLNAWVCFVLPTVHYLCFTVRSYVPEMDMTYNSLSRQHA
jgi:hypothetical protein